ncbi:MAG: hypothetical protein C0404_10705 [Verrucomicrobia bacterium]|nr:hypothetical protein [Verrucomicrobiota bacterium]
MYSALLRFADRHTAFLGAVLLSVFPGCFFTIRGDLSLYFLFISGLLYCLSRLSAKPSWRTAVITGVVGGCLYLCRSDGLYVSILTFVFAFLVLKETRRYVPVAIAVFGLTLGLFLVVRYAVMGSWGASTGTRAFEAFYQAEGLHDEKGGSWQDYTERGLKRFGPPEQYGHSMVRLIVFNIGAVGRRAVNNFALVKEYVRDSTGIRSLLVLAIVLCAFLDRKLLRVSLLVALPCILTSCIYLAFYFQRSYFVMLSFGLVMMFSAGLSAVFAIVTRKLNYERHLFISIVILSTVLASFLGYHTYRSFPGVSGETTRDRFQESLVFIRNNCVIKRAKFFAFDHAGSRSMYIYAGGGESTVVQSRIAGADQDTALKRLHAGGVSFVLATKENEELWALSERSTIAFANKHDDVRVLVLKAYQETADQP